jgi:hypothetical protein
MTDLQKFGIWNLERAIGHLEVESFGILNALV